MSFRFTPRKGLYAALLLLVLAMAVWASAQQIQGVQAPASLDPGVYKTPGAVHAAGLNFVFLADGYDSWNEFDDDVHLLLRGLRSFEPWRSFERYNIYEIKPEVSDLCTIKTENERKPTLRCDPERVNAYLGALPLERFKLVVLSRRGFESWANVRRLENSSIHLSIPHSPRDHGEMQAGAITFAHLMGHAFGLKDEEVFVLAKADSAAHMADGPNCAPDQATAEKWWGAFAGKDGVGYFKGCGGNPEYVKPMRSSLMNLNELGSFDPRYGPVSDNYLRNVLDACFSGKSEAPDPAFLAQYPEFRACGG